MSDILEIQLQAVKVTYFTPVSLLMGENVLQKPQSPANPTAHTKSAWC